MPLLALLLSLWHLFAADATRSDSLRTQILLADQALFIATVDACDGGQAAPALAADLAFIHNRIDSDHPDAPRAQAEDCGRQRGGSATLQAQATATVALRRDCALQWGRHRYYAMQADGHAQLTGDAGFVHLWRRVDGRWQLQRAVDFGAPSPR